MKKINKLFIFVFALFVAFIGFNKVEAYNCMYRALDSSVDEDYEYFMTYDFNTIIHGSFLSSSATFYANTNATGQKLRYFVTDISSSKLLPSDTNKCYPFMYFRENKTGDFYFSDSLKLKDGSNSKYCDGKICYNIYQSVNNYSKSSLGEGVNLLDFTAGGSERTPDNTTINDMMCTYFAKLNSTTQLYSAITLRISKGANGTYSYSIYEDGKDMSSTYYSTGKAYLTDAEMSSLRSSKTGQYGCPSNVKLTYSKEYHVFGNDTFQFTINYDDTVNESKKREGTSIYDFVPTASFITYHDTTGTLGKWFNYKLDGDENDKIYFSIAQYKVLGEDTKYEIAWGYDVPAAGDLNKVNFTVDFHDKNDHFSGDESDLNFLYTDCFTTTTGFCSISEQPWTKARASDPDVQKFVSHAGKDAVDLEKAEIALNLDIQLLYGGIKSPLSKLNPAALNYKIKIGGKNTTFNTVEANDNICRAEDKYHALYNYCGDLPDDEAQLENYLTIAMGKMYSYCTKIYENVGKANNVIIAEDCDAFYEFYQQLANDGIISASGAGCEMLSTDFSAKLKWILDILKIMGPIVAIALGTLDFVRAIASGDADKEMKSAFKRLLTRLIAAALLFIIPFILAVLMDIFLKNKEGYNTDNPFCNIVDWNK